ncbi:MAG: hypothetical protein V1893_02965 [Candidatus Omnitrophota bacterium]
MMMHGGGLGMRAMGVFSIIPATIFLTISFFVLFANRNKAESSALKVFGYVVTTLLWCCAFLVLTAGIYTISTGKCAMMKMMRQMGCSMKQGMMEEEQRGMCQSRIMEPEGMQDYHMMKK